MWNILCSHLFSLFFFFTYVIVIPIWLLNTAAWRKLLQSIILTLDVCRHSVNIICHPAKLVVLCVIEMCVLCCQQWATLYTVWCTVMWMVHHNCLTRHILFIRTNEPHCLERFQCHGKHSCTVSFPTSHIQIHSVWKCHSLYGPSAAELRHWQIICQKGPQSDFPRTVNCFRNSELGESWIELKFLHTKGNKIYRTHCSYNLQQEP